MDGMIRAAVGTPEIRVADVSYNMEQILTMTEQARQEGVKLLVLPELVLTGYTCQDLFHQTRLLGEAEQALRLLAEKTKESGLLLALGTPYRVDGKLYNCAACIFDGYIKALIPKRNLPNYSEFYERRWFTPGAMEVRKLPMVTSEGEAYEVPFGAGILLRDQGEPLFTLAAEVCEDLWVPDPPSTAHCLAGATVIANPSASDEMVGKDAYRRDLVRLTSARLVCAYLYANAGEGESTTDLVYGGQNLIAENGSILAESRRFTTGLTLAEIDLERLDQERQRLTTYPAADERSARYHVVRLNLGIGERAAAEKTEEGLSRFVDPRPFVPEDPRERHLRCEEIFTLQALGLKKRLKHIGAGHTVIGLSGGLDSTLALLVTARAFDLLGLPRENIIAVTMPAFGTTDRTYRNAVLLAEKLHTTLREINIKEAVLLHFRDIGHDPEEHSVTYENSQARERTQILMDVANQCGGIVIGTGDLSELALGWATYNGDHMSMYAVNVGVPKTLVRYLVKYAADTAEDPALAECLRDVLDTPVSPELLPPTGDGTISQKTEDLVGPYELHDFFLYYILRFGFSPKKIFALALRAFSEENQRAQGYTPSLYERDQILYWMEVFYRRFFSQQFKRSCLPDGPKVGSIAVSPRGDLRMPSDASAALWLKELSELR